MYSGQSFSFLDFIEDKDAFLASDWQLESKRFNKMYMMLFAFPVIRRYIYRNIVDTVDLNKYAGILDTAVDNLQSIDYNIACSYGKFLHIYYGIRVTTKQQCIDYYHEYCQTSSLYIILYAVDFYYILFFIKHDMIGIFDINSYDICIFHISKIHDIIPANTFKMSVFQIIGYN